MPNGCPTRQVRPNVKNKHKSITRFDGNYGAARSEGEVVEGKVGRLEKDKFFL